LQHAIGKGIAEEICHKTVLPSALYAEEFKKVAAKKPSLFSEELATICVLGPSSLYGAVFPLFIPRHLDGFELGLV
jgi:hypothetical protein